MPPLEIRAFGGQGFMALRSAVACALPALARAAATAAGNGRALALKSSPSAMQSASILCSGKAADELMEALMCFGATSCSIEDANKEEEEKDGPVPWQAGDSRSFWSKSCITAMFGGDVDVSEVFALAADTLGLKEVPKYELKIIHECDWLQQVKDSFQPVQVLPRFWIVPEWCTPPDSEATNIILNPGLAFGTGEHPTTKLCLKWLHKSVRSGDNILDYGTGSGILAIAALKMGASHAVGVDIDPMAVSSSASNATLNALDPHAFEVFIAAADDKDDPVPHGPGVFDVVVANILLNPLLTLAKSIAGYTRPKGKVGLSGIILEQVESVVRTYSPFLRDIEISDEDGWACVCGIRKCE
ncbi:uncharacterized protein LOC9654635 [Selaginella moellendorffii]|uniref:uncharacterized protein LOC9654635 n=1 Tax=Selaginella moellendorffii TaxID=88036 RepID=UPI000D1C3DDD|nr:uncharacterized protein LOC9654635 [Selaginella moellendorffii]|eukprot:XP_002983178.2 uncharacterized protein LOC9654635 [Selaginella moellendorffii]